jgi:hypothetical protein
LKGVHLFRQKRIRPAKRQRGAAAAKSGSDVVVRNKQEDEKGGRDTVKEYSFRKLLKNHDTSVFTIKVNRLKSSTYPS